MWAENRVMCSLRMKALIEELTHLNRVVKVTNTVVSSTFVVLKNDKVFNLLVPDGEVNGCRTTTDTILSTAANSCLKLLEEGNHPGMADLSTTDFTVETTDSTGVDPDASSLRNVSANSHITAKDRIETVIGINKHAASELPKGRSNACHNRRWNIDTVL